MQNQLIGFIHKYGLGFSVAVVAMCLVATGVLAQTDSPARAEQGAARGTTGARSAAERPDFSGMWVRLGTPQQISNSDMFHPDLAPMTARAKERYRIVRKGITDPLQQAREDIDPILEPYCMEPGYPRVLLRPGAMEIVQTPQALYMNFDEHSQSRRVYMDGRKHPANAPPTFMGHSIGWWEGETLVTETAAFNDLTWLDGIGTPHSTELKIVEHIRKLARNANAEDTMKIEFRFEDPKAFTGPWTGEKVFGARPDWELMEYVICENSTGDAWWKALVREGGTREP